MDEWRAEREAANCGWAALALVDLERRMVVGRFCREVLTTAFTCWRTLQDDAEGRFSGDFVVMQSWFRSKFLVTPSAVRRNSVVRD